MVKQFRLLGLAAIAALAITAFAATSAQAAIKLVNVYASDQPSFVGWAHVQDKAHPNDNFVTAFYQTPNHQWRTFELKKNEWVYVERYANGWDWAYSYTYKYWFVMPTNDILVRQVQQPIAPDCKATAGHMCPLTSTTAN